MIRMVVGLALCMGTWSLVLRRGAAARPLWRAPPVAAILETAPILLGFAACLGATDRPLLSGLVIAALAAGLSLADRVKRVVLDEPVVFADRAELLEVFRHPSLYLPFAGSAWVLGAAGAGLAAFALLLAWLEPPLWPRSTPSTIAEAAICAGLAYGCFAVPAATPWLLRRLSALYTRRLTLSRDPAQDAAAFGPLACLALHATLAAAERPSRRLAAATEAAPLATFAPAAGPVVLVQAESFFDPARLHPALAGLLPHFEALAAAAVQRGRLAVPAWGANTVRTEFAVLTGVGESTLGLDRFNPYEAFALGTPPPLPSLVRAAKRCGYRTVFVHPFDLRFYGRSRVLPLLGFDELVGPEAFAQAPRRGWWVADEALAEVVAAVLDRLGPRVFVFAATMEAHGPWGAAKPGQAVTLPPALCGIPEADQVAQWLWHLQGTDRMMHRLAEAVSRDGAGWLAVYGDHQPSLPGAFKALGCTDQRSDYVIWRTARPERPMVQDLTAEALGMALASAAAAA